MRVCDSTPFFNSVCVLSLSALLNSFTPALSSLSYPHSQATLHQESKLSPLLAVSSLHWLAVPTPFFSRAGGPTRLVCVCVCVCVCMIIA